MLHYSRKTSTEAILQAGRQQQKGHTSKLNKYFCRFYTSWSFMILQEQKLKLFFLKKEQILFSTAWVHNCMKTSMDMLVALFNCLPGQFSFQHCRNIFAFPQTLWDCYSQLCTHSVRSEVMLSGLKHVVWRCCARVLRAPAVTLERRRRELDLPQRHLATCNIE